jgi:hypothetical protein
LNHRGHRGKKREMGTVLALKVVVLGALRALCGEKTRKKE